MSLRIGSPDTFAYVVGVYVCRCGRTSEQHGLHAGETPPGWVPVRLEGDEEAEHMCPVCAAWAESQTRS
jgi:hypothetical protein